MVFAEVAMEMAQSMKSGYMVVPIQKRKINRKIFSNKENFT
jgi:hypothetical protein